MPHRPDALPHAAHARLIQAIGQATAPEQVTQTAIKELLFFHRAEVSPPCPCLIEPSVVLVVQGTKQMMLGGEAYPYDIDRFMITSLDLPATSSVIEASPDRPCLGLVLRLDMRLIAEVITQGALTPPTDRGNELAISLGQVTPALLDAFDRLVALLDDPTALAVLGPQVQREIIFRLLTSEQGARLWQIASVGSHSQRIARAIDWMKANFTAPLRIDELAARAQMSASSLHHHFRQLTAMSPLQYQKWLRLHEARRLMLNEHLDAASAAFRVGYESPSQFSREYSRLFGSPPKRDVATLLHRPTALAVAQGALTA